MNNREQMAAVHFQNNHLRGLLFCNPEIKVDLTLISGAAEEESLAGHKELQQCIEYLQTRVQHEADRNTSLFDINLSLQTALTNAQKDNEVLLQEQYLLKNCQDADTRCQHAIAALDFPRYVKLMQDNHDAEIAALRNELAELREAEISHTGTIMQERAEIAEVEAKLKSLVERLDLLSFRNSELTSQLNQQAFGSDKDAAEALFEYKLNEKQQLLDQARQQINELKYFNYELELQAENNEVTVNHWIQKHRGLDIQNTRNTGIVKALEKRFAPELAFRPLEIDLRNYNEDFSDVDVQLLAQVDPQRYSLIGMDITKPGTVGKYDDIMC